MWNYVKAAIKADWQQAKEDWPYAVLFLCIIAALAYLIELHYSGVL